MDQSDKYSGKVKNLIFNGQEQNFVDIFYLIFWNKNHN